MLNMEKSYTQRSGVFERAGADLCSKHDNPLNTYCCTDEQVVCVTCASLEHKGHTFVLVREERRRKQNEVKKLKQRYQELLSTKTHVQEKARETEDFCEAVLTRVIDLLQTQYMSLRQWIQAQETAALSTVQKQGAAEVKRKCAQLDRLTHLDSDVHFLRDWPSVYQLCEKDLTEFTDSLYLPFKLLQKAVGSLGNQLEEFCNKRFTTIKNANRFDHQVLGTEEDDVQQTDIDSHGHKKSDEMALDDYMKPLGDSYDACDLRLDPSTAHEDLLVSRDLKEVRLAPKSARGPAVRYPERFLNRRQLLCKEGLQADCCYYEVEVTGGKTEIALAYKVIDRKSFKKSAFGGNANSWSLDCTPTHYSVSHRGNSVQLTSVPEQNRIGVYLKFIEGTVSFYEVSDTMKFLYTTEGHFIEPLYPGFWIGENCCIKICDLTNDWGQS
ncbi:tripartite motif-containing protein 16-like isoform X2 [Boleophthalmus pectinirostris]|uniref:tripartite motif-containing protein 16-like isoform X2 n=1 Tax=Boleophthalmus pectinirostris TaxID=150288 RepID=UPI00242D63D6|nr:tripartite motif-containing protein 16-like isoform X2 [Boleophthalmus pectinirostris]